MKILISFVLIGILSGCAEKTCPPPIIVPEKEYVYVYIPQPCEANIPIIPELSNSMEDAAYNNILILETLERAIMELRRCVVSPQ